MKDDIAGLAALLRRHPRLFVLTGAGISTSSGIPGYRDAEGNWRSRKPITHQEFVGDPAYRRRYWARSMQGWPVIATARPNAAHTALAWLERSGRVGQLVTQNVDGLHRLAGSENVIDLHGRLRDVVCIDCAAMHARQGVQAMLEAANPGFVSGATATPAAAPDGDADVDVDSSSFVVPACPACGGMLKPDVVFFGANVPKERAGAALAAALSADAMLVAGSSLMVRSGYRLCEAAHAAGKPVVVVNRGRTRADHLLALKVNAECGAVLSQLAASL